MLPNRSADQKQVTGGYCKEDKRLVFVLKKNNDKETNLLIMLNFILTTFED
jgi:hypothetical protein